MSHDWDASTYHRVSAPQQAWAAEQFARIGELSGSEVILDAGCGSGIITAQLADLVPHGRVYGVDASASMVEHARAELGERATILCQDLAELALPEPVDLVFSNATFHWIPDHPRLFTRLFAALKPGGRLVAQCGGKGNIDRLRSVAEALAAAPPYNVSVHPWNYADVPETVERLTQAGFVAVQAWLEPKPTTPPEPREFVSSVCLLPHLEAMAPELREGFVDAVLEGCGTPLVLDYVRLNILARKPC